jgi:hypothetical protein
MYKFQIGSITVTVRRYKQRDGVRTVKAAVMHTYDTNLTVEVYTEWATEHAASGLYQMPSYKIAERVMTDAVLRLSHQAFMREHDISRRLVLSLVHLEELRQLREKRKFDTAKHDWHRKLYQFAVTGIWNADNSNREEI